MVAQLGNFFKLALFLNCAKLNVVRFELGTTLKTSILPNCPATKTVLAVFFGAIRNPKKYFYCWGG